MKPLPFSFYLQVLVCAALWGSAFPVIKLSYDALAIDGFGERMTFAGIRFMIAGLMIVPFCRSSVLSTLKSAPVGLLAWVILGQTVLQYVFFYYALSVSSGTLGALLVGGGSFWWMLLAPILLKTPMPSPKQWGLVAVCSMGIALAVYAPGAGSGKVGLGTAAFLLASLSGAFGAIGLKKMSAHHGSRVITSLSLFIGGFALLLLGVGGWSGFWRDLGDNAIWIILYLAFLSATAFTLWNRLIEQYSVNVLSTYRFLIPLCGVVESALLIESESIGLGIVLGGVLILGSIYGMGRLELSRTGSTRG
ncbi:DMT family transporter [Pelagicoccus sp. SDUM812002]|uniref:DMT family transporter n=1 Tax=Pelagicoccus sp. SDUM812002 TaxID=3041266 RepID=UPI00280ECC41|nr:DMT family transporter [Pelagicoccus sp. SDUM812002]MDQ8184038.1 DMT family transporter [Pelagicoccus sp. SDUM812002]